MHDVTTSLLAGVRILDLACGKGGDLGKWIKLAYPPLRYVGMDIAKKSLEDLCHRLAGKRTCYYYPCALSFLSLSS